MANEKFLVCPKCHCVDIRIVERGETESRWIQKAGVLLNHKNPETGLGDVIGVFAYCLNTECNYDWKVRKIVEASQLPCWPDRVTEDVDVIRIAVDGKMVPEEEEVNPIERNIEEMLGIADLGKKRRGRPKKAA
jgi:hypothetical protein